MFDNVGVGLTTGRTPHTVEEMAQDAVVFAETLGRRQVDLLGFSLGGFVAQEVALTRPALVRRLILAGTGPQGAPRMHGWREDITSHALMDQPDAEDLLYIFFPHSESGRQDGGRFLGRIFQRVEGRDQTVSLATRDAQYDAVVRWGIPDITKLQRLTGIRQPTLILQGDDDLMIPTIGSHTMAGLIPHAQLHIFPASAHASLFQNSERAAVLVTEFLTRD